MMRQSTKNIFIELSKKYNLPVQVIEVMCKHPFRFASEKIADKDDTKALMFAYLGKIKIKKKYETQKDHTGRS